MALNMSDIVNPIMADLANSAMEDELLFERDIIQSDFRNIKRIIARTSQFNHVVVIIMNLNSVSYISAV